MSTPSLTAPPKRRNRAKKPTWSFAGLTAEQWRADPERVRWAQTNTFYNDIVTVITNERVAGHTLNQAGSHSEGYHLGFVRGYESCVAQVLSLARGNLPPASPLGEPDYQEPQ